MTARRKGNITKFRRDKRLAVVGGLRSLALLGLLATMVFCIFEYREDLSPPIWRLPGAAASLQAIVLKAGLTAFTRRSRRAWRC